MKINGIDITEYGARLMDYTVTPSTVTNTYAMGYKSLFTPVLDTEISARQLIVTVHVQGSDFAGSMEKISALTSQLCTACELELADGFLYRCVYASSTLVKIMPTLHELAVTFSAVQHLPMEEIALAQEASQSVQCKSNIETECSLAVTPLSDAGEVTVMGITIRSLRAEHPVIVDGMNKLVTEDGRNKFIDTDLTDFPRLAPGENIISISEPEAVRVVISYYPTYL